MQNKMRQRVAKQQAQEGGLSAFGPKKNTSICIAADLHERIKRSAKRENRSVNAEIEKVLRDHYHRGTPTRAQ